MCFFVMNKSLSNENHFTLLRDDHAAGGDDTETY